jgi:hypothetical protein
MSDKAIKVMLGKSRSGSPSPGAAAAQPDDAFSAPRHAASGLISLEEISAQDPTETDSAAMERFKKIPKVGSGGQKGPGGGVPIVQQTDSERRQTELIDRLVRPNLGDTPVPGKVPTPHLSDPFVLLPEALSPRRSGSWYSVLGAAVPEALRGIAPVFPGQTERTGRSWGVSATCAPVPDGDSSTTRFTKLRIQTCSVAEFGGTARPAAIVQHYADLDAARQWFNYAYALASSNEIIAALDEVNPRTGRWDDQGGAEPIGFLAQVRYVRAITEAIANGYNALNIPWNNDPIARGLWRDYFAGQDSASDTSVSSDYNAGQFFRKDRDAERLNSNWARAILKARNSNAGAIPAALSKLVADVTPQQDRHPIRFYFSAGVMLVSMTSDDTSPYYASRTTNRGFATSALSDNRATGPWSSRHEAIAWPEASRDNIGQERFAVRIANVERFEEYQGDWYANRNGVDRVRRDWGISSGPEYTDWRAFTYDTWTALQPEEEISATAPLRWYMNFLREWTKSLTTTTPMGSDDLLPGLPLPLQRSPQTRGGIPRRDVTRVLVDSLSWASDLNMRWVRALGDSNFNAALAASLQDQVSASVPEPNRTVTLIGETVGGVGSIIGNALVPGVGSIIGSGVSAVTSLVARLIPEQSRLRFGRDDLGRPKPSFERLALDGSIRDGQLPTFGALPPGYCRRLGVNAANVLGSSLCGVSAGGLPGGTGGRNGEVVVIDGGGGGSDNGDDSDEEPLVPTPVKIIAVLAVLAMLILALNKRASGSVARQLPPSRGNV